MMCFRYTGNHSSNAEAARHGQMPEMKAEARGTRYRRTWLGPALWRAECADMTLNEFMLQVGAGPRGKMGVECDTDLALASAS